jgi:hypothetical protein
MPLVNRSLSQLEQCDGHVLRLGSLRNFDGISLVLDASISPQEDLTTRWSCRYGVRQAAHGQLGAVTAAPGAEAQNGLDV